MISSLFKKASRLFVILIITGLSVLFISRLIVVLQAKPLIVKIDDVKTTPVAVVFGAGLWRDGTPTPVLRDRVKTAADLYFKGSVIKLLMSGDNRFVDYNEPAAMFNYAVELGIPPEDIVLDYAGRRTYDTCFRAKEIFGVKEVILVTQKYHLPRALYTCRILGLEAIGTPADQRQYSRRSLTFWNIREFLATFVALVELNITHPLPVLGEQEPIF